MFLQMPLPRDNKDLDYSRWQHNLIGIIQIEVAYDKQIPMGILIFFPFLMDVDKIN